MQDSSPGASGKMTWATQLLFWAGDNQDMARKHLDNGVSPTCKWCKEISCRKQGRIWLCAMHYRFQQMRVLAKRQHVAVPAYEALATMLAACNLVCPGCSRAMNWLAVDGQATVVTLQHDRSGEMRFLCRSCNTRHASFPADSFYEIDHDKKRCPKCKIAKPLDAFCMDRGARWAKRKSTCRECACIQHREWVSRNRERVNQQQRARRARVSAGKSLKGRVGKD